MINTFHRFWNDESGPELVEWAVVTIILLIASVVLYLAVGKVLGTMICSIWCWINAASTSQGHGITQRSECDAKDNNCGGTS
jgi:Flp pilus assembly pilin Flp